MTDINRIDEKTINNIIAELQTLANKHKLVNFGSACAFGMHVAIKNTNEESRLFTLVQQISLISTAIITNEKLDNTVNPYVEIIEKQLWPLFLKFDREFNDGSYKKIKFDSVYMNDIYTIMTDDIDNEEVVAISLKLLVIALEKAHARNDRIAVTGAIIAALGAYALINEEDGEGFFKGVADSLKIKFDSILNDKAKELQKGRCHG